MSAVPPNWIVNIDDVQEGFELTFETGFDLDSAIALENANDVCLLDDSSPYLFWYGICGKMVKREAFEVGGFHGGFHVRAESGVEVD